MSKQMSNKNKLFAPEIGALIACVVIAVLIITLVFVFTGASTDDGDAELTSSVVVGDGDDSSGEGESSEPIEESGVPEIKYYKVDNANATSGDLILVNSSHEYVFPSESELVEVYEYKTSSYKVGDTDVSLNKSVVEKLNAMADAFYSATDKSNLTVTVGYLDKEAQQKTYDKKVESLGEAQAEIWAQKPGYSEHHTGLAFNLSVYPSDGDKIGEGTYKWITDNCWQYGFIRRYPDNKSALTSVNDDPNHFRYVGVAHACYMHLNGLCLEEYLELLRERNVDDPLEVTDGVNSYEIYCCTVSGGGFTEIPVKEGAEYSVSGDNCGRYVVTVKK